jgi:hypothetical protein
LTPGLCRTSRVSSLLVIRFHFFELSKLTMENEKKTGESHVPLKKRHIEYLTSVGNGDTLEEPRVVVTEAKSSVVLDRSDHTPPGVPVSGKGHDVRVAALNVSNSTCPFTSLERTSSSSSMMSIFPMPPLLRSTTSWESLIGATATDAMAPPFFNFTTSRGHPLISEPIFDTPVITRTMPPAFFGSVPPQFRSEAIGNHSFGGASMRKGMFTGRKSTAGSLLTDNLPQPTPLSEISGMEMDECNVAEALLNLTPAVPARRVPFAEIGSQTTNSPAEKLYAIHSAGTHAASPDILKKRSRQLLENVPITDVPCKCKNSKCLKLYCVCFQTGKFCDGNLCKCKDCLNTEQHNGPGGKRSRAVKKILHRRIDAFDKRLKKKTGEGCSCKKTR